MADILVVAAHPDDEILGCGGTMARHSRLGDRVHVLIVAEGATSRSAARDVQSAQTALDDLRSAAAAACREVGAESPHFAAMPDNRLDSVDRLDVVKAVERVVAQVRPETIYTHAPGDLNIDHQIVSAAVMTAARPLPDVPVRRIYFFEVPSSTEWATPHAATAFLPNHFVDIAAELPRKLAALRHYAAEMRAFPHPRSLAAVEALARWRGASVGAAAAEAFMVGRTLG